MISDWDIHFLNLAKEYSRKSKDPSTKVGAVIVDSEKILVSCGFNGFPRKIEDKKENLENREEKLKRIVHAEINALIFSKGKNLKKGTLYTYPFMPCSRCTPIVIQSEISRVVAPYSENPRWINDFKISKELFEEAGVTLELYHFNLELIR